MTALLVDLEEAAATRDAAKVQEIAVQALAAISPSGRLAELAALAQASRDLDQLTREFDADEEALAYLDRETFLSELEDEFALAVPALVQAEPTIEKVILLLAALAGPYAPLLSFGLLVACKVALAALEAWAKKRTGGKQS